MPRKSSKKLSRKSDSQPSTSKVQRLDTTATALSQTRIDQHYASSQQSVKELVDNCVRYFVFNAGQNRYFRIADMYKNVVPKVRGQPFQRIIEQATKILKDVYGYHLLSCNSDQNSSNGFIVSNALPYMDYTLNENEEENKDVNKILLLLILSHIFLSNNSVTEASLLTFLSHLKIKVNTTHPLFGQIKDYIMNTLVKQKYLATETDALSKEVTFSWGARSEKEISKHEILDFVCKMYKDRTPKSWEIQFEAAEEQRLQNNESLAGNAMDIEQ